jgi:hypothetical protein
MVLALVILFGCSGKAELEVVDDVFGVFKPYRYANGSQGDAHGQALFLLKFAVGGGSGVG